MLMTMSTSRAPSKMTRCVSKCLTSAGVAPSGNPTTEHTPTGVPRSSDAHVATHAGLTHTVAKLILRRLSAEPLDLLPRRVRLQQRVIDQAGDAARRRALRRMKAQPRRRRRQ